MPSDEDTGRSPIQFSLLELICFILLLTVAQGSLTAIIDCGHARRDAKRIDDFVESIITTADGGSAARTGPGQAVIFFVSLMLALLGSAWGVWAAKSFSAPTSLQRAGLMALGLVWISMLPVAFVLLVALPFFILEMGFWVLPALVTSWVVVVGANTIPVRSALRARRERIERDRLDRLGPLPPLPGAEGDSRDEGLAGGGDS